MIGIPNIETPTPVVRLQVWHLDKRGQSRAMNRQLSEYLAQTSLSQDWSITPCPSHATRDHYVPLEVDLTFCKTCNPDQESSDASLRWLFNNNLATEIQVFFSQRTTKPIQMNVFPIGQDLAEDIKINFTHFHLFFSLAFDFNQTIEDSIGIDRNGLTETLRVVGCALDAQASLFDGDEKVGEGILKGQSTIGQVWTSLMKGIRNPALGRQLAKHYGIGKEGSAEDTTDIKSCWEETLGSLDLFQSLAGEIQTCVSNITVNQTAINKEEVHLALIQANLATIVFAEYQKNMTKVLQMLEDKYNKDIKGNQCLMGFALVLLVAAGVTLTSGLSAPLLAVYGCGGLGVGIGVGIGVDQSIKWKKTYNKECAVTQFDETIDSLADALKDAKIGLASIYCSDILQMPFQSMGTRERVGILKNLGIDMKELDRGSVYNQELIELRMRRFNEVYGKFDNEREAIKRDIKLKELVTPRPSNGN